jgi:hypothetical protein
MSDFFSWMGDWKVSVGEEAGKLGDGDRDGEGFERKIHKPKKPDLTDSTISSFLSRVSFYLWNRREDTFQAIVGVEDEEGDIIFEHSCSIVVPDDPWAVLKDLQWQKSYPDGKLYYSIRDRDLTVGCLGTSRHMGRYEGLKEYKDGYYII